MTKKKNNNNIIKKTNEKGVYMKTIKENSNNEIIIKNSRFITLLFKIKEKEDIEIILKESKQKYPKATHYCYAYKIGENIKKASDDGEPGGTAGMPMLNILDKEDITNILAITIRYFGGIKLGAGGLIRAYSKSVKEALNNIEKIELIKGVKCKISFPYTKEKEILQQISHENIISKTYLEKITYTVLLPADSPILNQENLTILEKKYIEKETAN